MKEEVDSALNFLIGLLKKARLPSPILKRFKECLFNRMVIKYKLHWHPLTPERGSAFRSIGIDHNSVDPLILGALSDAFRNDDDKVRILNALPKELTLWVDPRVVAYKFGDFGSVGVLYEKRKQQYEGSSWTEETSDYESGMSSVGSSPCSSPSQSPHEYDYRQQPPPSQPSHSIAYQCGQEAFYGSGFQNRCYEMQTTAALA